MSLAAATANGMPVTQYQIRANQGDPVSAQVGSNTIKNLTNGTSYTFQARAYNADGWGEWSDPSSAVTPYGTPSAVTKASMSANGIAPGTFNLNWNAVGDTGGGSVTYHWSFSGGGSGTTTGTSVTTKAVGAGTYSFTVYATNDHSGKQGDSASASGSIADPPPANPSGSVVKGVHPPSGWGTCSTGWNFVAASYQDVPNGSYKLVPSLSNSPAGNGQIGSDFITVTLSGSGSVSTHGCLGNPGAGSTVTVDFQAVGGGAKSFSVSISGAGWNALPTTGVGP